MNLSGTIRLNKLGIFIIVCVLFVFSYHVLSKRVDDFKNGTTINMKTLLNVAIKAAENGGKQVVENKDQMIIKSKGLTKEGLQDSVTNADILSHCTMSQTIRHFFPTIKLISEEKVENCKNEHITDYDTKDNISTEDEMYDSNEVTVWIDPLDATHEYTEKLYQYVTTMVCVAVKGKPVIGVIHKPFEKVTSWAWLNKGFSDDLNTKKVDNNTEKLKVIVSLSHKGDIEKILEKNKNIEVTSAAGAGYKALEVAKKHVDAYLHITAIKKWDLCAGNAVLNALGGKMVNKYGAEIDYSNDVDVVNENGLIASLNKYKDFIGKLDVEK